MGRAYVAMLAKHTLNQIFPPQPRSLLSRPWAFPSIMNPRSIPRTNCPRPPPGHGTSAAVQTVISVLPASQLSQLDHQVGVGAGLVPALRTGTHEGCPYTLPGSAAMYTEGTASRPPTAKGLAVTRNSLYQRAAVAALVTVDFFLRGCRTRPDVFCRDVCNPGYSIIPG
jgi:hypothetical protein